MRKTKAQVIKDEMREKGYVYLGTVMGLYSFRGNSNLYRYLKHLGKKPDEVEVKVAARAGRHMSDGHQLLVFEKEKAHE